MNRCRALLCGLLALMPLAAEAPLFEDAFEQPGNGWLVDEFSRFEDGRYVIDARGEGGYYRWIEQPRAADYLVTVEAVKGRGNNTEPLFGLLLRVQESWRDSYFLGVNGAQGYFFGKFVGGNAVILKEGRAEPLRPGGEPNLLGVRAAGSTFSLEINGEAVATVADPTFAAGAVGLFVEAPALVRFDNLRVTAGGAVPPVGPGDPPPVGPGPRTIFADTFDRPTGWAEDQFRQLAGGEYHLRNEAGDGEQKSFLSWQPATADLTDFAASVDARQRIGSPGQLFGLCWRVVDGAHFYFFLINPDGAWYAGARNGDEVRVLAKETRHPSIRPGEQVNTLGVRCEGRQHQVMVNGVRVTEFTDATIERGAVGLYLEQTGHVSFDNLLVTDLGAGGPPVVGAAPDHAIAWPVGPVTYHEPLSGNIGEQTWLVDPLHQFAEGGYVVTAPAEGSETLLALPTAATTDGVVEVNARAVAGPVLSSFGLVVRGDTARERFYYLLMNSAGKYFVGRCIDGRFETVDTGPIATLRGGDAGQGLQVRLQGGRLRFAVNGQEVSRLDDEQLPAGAVGLHAEHGVTACFRNLRVYAPAGE